MFNTKNKTEMQLEKTNGGNGTTLISAGQPSKVTSAATAIFASMARSMANSSSAKIVIGANGVVEGDIYRHPGGYRWKGFRKYPHQGTSSNYEVIRGDRKFICRKAADRTDCYFQWPMPYGSQHC